MTTHAKDMASKPVSEDQSLQSLTSMAKTALAGPLPPVANNGKPPKAKKPSALAALGKLRRAAKRPLPTETGNGTYVTRPEQTTLLQDAKQLRKQDFQTLVAVVRGKLKGEQFVDDRTMLMERIIQLVAGLPTNSRSRQLLTNNLISELWNSLDHPVQMYMGEKYLYRTADGSWNNILYPQMGAAGTAYARSVRPSVMAPKALPDPGLIFDSVMSRSSYKKHPNNVSSILWYWATLVIHDIFWTDQRDISTNKTSSYLDLSPLYGSNQAMQDSVRTFRDGLLKPDAFADKRLLGMPPGVCVLMIMFNRFHNYVAGNLAVINEGGRFTRPAAGSPDAVVGDDDYDATSAAAWKKYDNDLFQTARLVTCGLYINVMLVDYVRNIINVNRCDSTYTLDPRAEAGIDAGLPDGADRGTGNVVSAEFNLCYRWHSCISAKDEAWVEQFYEEILGKRADEATMGDLLGGFVQFERAIPADPGARVFGGFARDAANGGRFRDDDLVGCLADAIEDVAGAFGARNVPKAMRAVEVLGILQARQWNVAGLNEFRRHFGLQAYDSFEAINPDPVVAGRLRNLYAHPDLVELYPGVVAEAAKDPLVPGVGIAPTYTLSRVVLSDAVCLVRGDRHYTVDYNAHSLTNWGYNEVQYDLGVNHGCVFSKLFLRAFPDHFRPNSVYAHYPMVVPAENRRILAALGREAEFDFGRPARIPARTNITSYGGALQVLTQQAVFKVTWNEGLHALLDAGGDRFMLAGDTAAHAAQRRCMGAQLYHAAWRQDVKRFYAGMASSLLRERSHVLVDDGPRQIDLIHDFGNVVHTRFAARVFNLPLKTAANPGGVYTEQELYAVLAIIFVAIFFDLDPAKSFALRQGARAVAQQLGALIETNVKLTRGLGLRGLFTGAQPKDDDALAAYGTHVVHGLAAAGLSTYDIAWSQVLPTACAMVPNQAQVFAQAVDFYLSPAGAPHRPALHAAAVAEPTTETDAEANDALLLGYAMEGIRLAGTFGSYRRAATATTITEDDDGRRVAVQAGDRVFVSFVSAARDPEHFPDPDTVNPRRPLDAYIHYGAGPHACLGRDISQVALVELFRALFRHKNVRRAAGPQGELKKVPRPGGFFVYMREDYGSYFPFPVSMKVEWDE